MITILKKITSLLPYQYQNFIRYHYSKKLNKLDAEMLYVSKLLKSKRRFLDIGANDGIYSLHFKRSFQNIDAFEPVKEITCKIEAIQNESFRVHNIALSNTKGKLKFYIPVSPKGILAPNLASLEERDDNCEIRIVNVNTVDSYDFDDVDLIKIDVEGHEKSVIEGAHKTIKKTMPILIVEIEQRHIKQEIDEIFQSILNYNYNGFFIQNGSLISLNEFSYDLNQKPYLENELAAEYVNNFIFIPNSKNIQ